MQDDFIHRQGGDGRYFHGEDYKGDGRRLNALVFGGIGALAGYKFYQRWRPVASSNAELLGASIRHGALMAIRWKAWFVTTLWWLVTTPLWVVLASGILDRVLDEHPTDYDYGWNRNNMTPDEYRYWIEHLKDVSVTGTWFHGSLALVWGIFALHIVIGFFAVGANYVRHIHESEFQERWFFRIMTPFESLVAKLDWKILSSLVVVPVALAIISYNQ
jgi:hypothetical protein